MSEQEAVPVVTIPPPPSDLLKQVILAQGEIERIQQDMAAIEFRAIQAVEMELCQKRKELDTARKVKAALIARATEERVYTQDEYILHDSSRELRKPRVEEFRKYIPSADFARISETTISLTKADALLGKNRVRLMCDIQRGPPILDVTQKGKKHYQTDEGPWRSSA